MKGRALRAALEDPTFPERFVVPLNGGTASWVVAARGPEHAKQRWLDLVPKTLGHGATFAAARHELAVHPAPPTTNEAGTPALAAFPGADDWGVTPATASRLEARRRKKGR